MMCIKNYMSSRKFASYAYNQIAQIDLSLSELNESWNHAYLVSYMLNQTKSKLMEMIQDTELLNDTSHLHERKIEKYTTWIEVLRLVKYQYGRYSNYRESYCEGLYATLSSLSAVYFGGDKGKNIAVVGCGPGRTVGDLAMLFPKCVVSGLDYSILSLVIAEQLLCDVQKTFQMPFRDVNNEDDISSIMSVPSFGLKNVILGLFDFTDKCDLEYDLIVCSNTINLMPDHEIALKNLFDMLKYDGIIIYADLVGWRMDRTIPQTKLHSMKSIVSSFEEKGFETLDYFKGGPYVEVETADNRTEYTEYFYIGKKKWKL